MFLSCFFNQKFLFKTKDEWNGYGETFFFLDKSKLNEFNGKIFKKNYKNYIWSKEEDELLEKIIKY